jgi:hypothetical protein
MLQRKFSYNRNFKIFIPDDPISIPNITTLSYWYLETPLEIEYLLKQSQYISIGIVTGASGSFIISKKESTAYLTQGDPNTKYFINGTSPFLMSAMGGLRISAKILKRISLNVEPHFVKYFNRVNTTVMISGSDLIRLNTGITLQLNKP